jgi:TolA-binding protein
MSAQAMRDARLSRGGHPTGDDVPTLTADNISEFKRLGAQQGSPEGAQEPDEARAKRRKRRTYEAPEGAEDATSLGVVPLPPRQRLSVSTSGSSATTSAALAPSMARASLTPLPVIEGQDHSPQASDHLTAQQPQEAQEPPSQGSSEGSLELAFAQAARHLEAARWGEAIKAHELLISLTPNTQLRSKARYGLALALKGSGRHQEATSAFRALIQGDPAGALVPQALLEIGALQLSSGERAKGRATLMRLKSLYPQTSAARRADGLLP